MVILIVVFCLLNFFVVFCGWFLEFEKYFNWIVVIVFVCKLFIVFKIDWFRKKIMRKGERKEVMVKILMNILEVVLFMDYLCL